VSEEFGALSLAIDAALAAIKATKWPREAEYDAQENA